MGDIQQDPSMEEILASIKRVIREDGRLPSESRSARRASAKAEPVPASLPPPPPLPVEEDVLELDDPIGQGDDGLISDNAAAASRQSLAALTAIRSAPPPSDGGALEAVIRDMLRPILKDWLDEHLPQIVEELVTREISRITGRHL